MTTPSPVEVKHRITAHVYDGDDWLPLEWERFEFTLDADQERFMGASVTVTGLTPQLSAALSPQNDPGFQPFRFLIEQLDTDDDVIATLPPSEPFEVRMWIREIDEEETSARAVVTLASGESRLQDKKRIAGTQIDTGAEYVADLVRWSLNDVFGSSASSMAAILLTTDIPAGDRRKMMPGESHMDLIKPELDALNCRLADVWGKSWVGLVRQSTGTHFQLATFTQDDGAPGNYDGIVSTVRRRRSRDTDWYDGVLVKGEYTDGSGDRQEWYQASGAGANTRGRVITVNRAQPTSNMAEEIKARTTRRGETYTITARARFDVIPYSTLEVLTRSRLIEDLTVRAVTWRFPEGTMTLTTQVGDPIE